MPIRSAQLLRRGPDAINSALYAALSRSQSWKLWAAAVLSAGLLELPFPLAGPLPPWRSVFAWFGLVPLLWAILVAAASSRPRPLRRAFLLAYLCGVLWYMGNCYWIRDTMMQYGDMPPLAPTLLLSASAWCWASISASSAWRLRWCAGPPAARARAGRRAVSSGSALELAASRITPFPGISLATRRSTTLWSISSLPGPAFMASAFVLVAVKCASRRRLRSRPRCKPR